MIARLLQTFVAPDLAKELVIHKEVVDELVTSLQDAYDLICELAGELGRDGVAYVESLTARYDIQEEIQSQIPPVRGEVT